MPHLRALIIQRIPRQSARIYYDSGSPAALAPIELPLPLPRLVAPLLEDLSLSVVLGAGGGAERFVEAAAGRFPSVRRLQVMYSVAR